MTNLFTNADIISTFTRADAIADGTLVDVTDAARKAGLRFPVALTRAAWADSVAWSEATEKRKPEFTGQDETGRLHDVLWMTRLAMQAAQRRGTDSLRIPVEVHRVPAEGRGVRARRTALVAMLGPDDHGTPAVVIGLPHED